MKTIVEGQDICPKDGLIAHPNRCYGCPSNRVTYRSEGKPIKVRCNYANREDKL